MLDAYLFEAAISATTLGAQTAFLYVEYDITARTATDEDIAKKSAHDKSPQWKQTCGGCRDEAASTIDAQMLRVSRGRKARLQLLVENAYVGPRSTAYYFRTSDRSGSSLRLPCTLGTRFPIVQPPVVISVIRTIRAAALCCTYAGDFQFVEGRQLSTLRS